MELGSDGQLFDLFQRKGVLKEEAISFLLRALLEAVAYLHRHDIIHRDLKPENIVLIHVSVLILRDFQRFAISANQVYVKRKKESSEKLYVGPLCIFRHKC